MRAWWLFLSILGIIDIVISQLILSDSPFKSGVWYQICLIESISSCMGNKDSYS